MTPTRSRRTIRPHWPPGITKKNAAQRIFNIPELVSETVHWQVQGLDDFMYKVAGHRGKEALASLVTVNTGDVRVADAALRDVRFPKLRGELVTVLSLSSYGRREPEWRWPLHGLPEDWAKLFRRISVLFLNLEKVEIGHNVLVADKVVKNFARRYPAPKDP
ncbi:hypothetical protein DTO013E5_364 [Penicillium roqueforti]|uniref:uncharacterized protein n=1 Tax=Penicillium roqueforti TaxID=5082 RepID=UPI00190C8C51|nr:uncharacterized protein LCP9604111_774 [Penicillium roqueforti]KAF9253248.1 hypothetical protein LCP9604111_774 [Penicillium roqueforti]KAI1838764.1 hypothetical protein CBS147337_489 [Penicillium roqueforti]KAI2680347.1 hypothetical protein CBS147355_3327 [Penicillium roqueforti]KAI2691264.1 hypothetical protein LCP963914a_1465 [Penicillium roqueforti]KAI2706742.1 hypothetical protein CBS147372_653 [Penicillium roqueforti]